MDLHQAGNERRNALTRYNIQRYIRLHDRQEHVYEKEETGRGVPTGRRHHRRKSSCHARSTTGPASEKLLLWVDNENTDLKADGSDFVTVVAAIADKNGNIKRLNNYYVKFHVEGEGRILGGANILANPAPVKWGTAPVLIQSTLKPGKIKITASVLFEGSQMPASAVLELESKPAAHPLIYTESEAALIPMSSDSPFGQSAAKSASELEQERLLKERNAQRLKEVEKQQADFGEKK